MAFGSTTDLASQFRRESIWGESLMRATVEDEEEEDEFDIYGAKIDEMGKTFQNVYIGKLQHKCMSYGMACLGQTKIPMAFRENPNV
jgi:hypothetical protein